MVDLVDVSLGWRYYGHSQKWAVMDSVTSICIENDLDAYEIPADTYELVCVFRYLKRDMFPQLCQCVRSGGRIFYETYNRNYLRIVPEFNPAFLLEVGELSGYFADWKLLHSIETGHISSVVAVKP